MPDSACKELASFQRQFIEQRRELKDINKRSRRDDRSSETLEPRRRIRETQLRINCLMTQINRRSLNGPDSDSSASRSASRGSSTPRPPTDPPPPRSPPPAGSPLHMPQCSYVGEITPQLPLCRGRWWRRNAPTDEKTQAPSEGATPGAMRTSDTDPSPIDTFRVTDNPSFNPSIPPLERTDCVSGQASAYPWMPTKRESSRPRLRLPDTFPRSPRQVKEYRKRLAKRAKREQTLTTTIDGLKEDEPTQTPQTTGISGVSPIQCGICATHRIPSLHLCYRCFPEIVVN